MCKTCRRKRKKRSRKGSLSGFNLNGVELSRALGIGAGAVGAKLVDKPAQKYLSRFLTDNPETSRDESKIGRITISGLKIVGGLLLNARADNEMVQDAGLGAAAVGALDLMSIFMRIPGMNGFEDYEYVGSTEIKVPIQDLLNGTSFDDRLEHFHDVAGADAYIDESMEIAGY